MPVNCFEKLRQYLHVVGNNLGNTENDKLFKVKPITDAVRAESVKIEAEEYLSIDEQIITCKTKRNKIRQYNRKKPKKWVFKNLVCAGSESGMIYDFYINSRKDDAELEFKDLQKCSHVVAKLSKHTHNKRGHKLYFDNWFTTLPLLHFLKSKQVCAVRTIRANRLAD